MSTVNVNTIKPLTDDVHLNLQAGGGTKMTVLSTGKVGIGHTAAAQSLTVVGSVSADSYKFPDGTEQTTAGVSKYATAWLASHGSVTVANGSTHTITHNLGTVDVVVGLYGATASDGTGATDISDNTANASGSTDEAGAWVTAFSANTITVQLGAEGYRTFDSSGNVTHRNWTSGYLKAVVIG